MSQLPHTDETIAKLRAGKRAEAIAAHNARVESRKDHPMTTPTVREIPPGRRVERRTFEAKQHPKGSPERERLNADPLTSEYLPSYRFCAFDGVTRRSFTSKREAELWLNNGWTNYPTWNVALWFGNDEGMYNEARERTRIAISDNTSYFDDDTSAVDRDSAIYDLSRALESMADEIMEATGTPPTGFVADILGWAMGAVDWREIAEHYIDDETE